MKPPLYILSALILCCSSPSPAADINWRHFQDKYDAIPPLGLPALVREYYRANQRWPTNKTEVWQFEAQKFGTSNSVDWSNIGNVGLAQSGNGRLALVWEHKEDEQLINGGVDLSPTVSSPLSVERYFTQWRTADFFDRCDMADVQIITPVIAGESSNAVEQLLGPPDIRQTNLTDLVDVGSAWIYTMKDRRWLHEPALVGDQIRVLFDIDGRCIGAEGRTH